MATQMVPVTDHFTQVTPHLSEVDDGKIGKFGIYFVYPKYKTSLLMFLSLAEPPRIVQVGFRFLGMFCKPVFDFLVIGGCCTVQSARTVCCHGDSGEGSFVYLSGMGNKRLNGFIRPRR